MENKFPRGKIALYMLCAAGALILLIISVTSFGWFVTNKTSQGNMTGFRAVDLKFELASKNTVGLYDAYLSSSDGTVINAANETGLTATGAGGSEIRWRMSSDSNFGNLGGDGIQPGSFGTLTFYVIPKQDTDLKLTFSLDTVLYKSGVAPTAEDSILASDNAATKLVKGHILFFEECTDGVYSGRINGNTFKRTITDAKADNAYKFDIYWVWPNVIDQLILPANDNYLVNSGCPKIISDEDTTALISEIKAEADNYFISGEITNLSVMLDSVSKGSIDTSFNEDNYKALNTAWDNSDNMIGRNVGYIELRLTAEETAEAGT